MKRSNRLVILVGVLLAILAFVGGVFVLNQQAQQTQPEAVTVTVLVAKVDIAIGDDVVPDKVETKEVDPADVVGTPFGDPSQVNGRPAVAAIPKGSQVSQESVGYIAGTPTCIACLLQPGEKAIAFQVDRVTGLDFLILPGDHIDVVISQAIPVVQPTVDTIDSPPGEQRFEVVTGLEQAPTVKTILQNKRVLYVSSTKIRPTTAATEATPSPGQQTQPTPELTSIIIIFAGTDQDAEAIKLAQRDVETVGTLSAVLRAPDDENVETTTGVTISLLIERYGVPVPNIVLLQPQ